MCFIRQVRELVFLMKYNLNCIVITNRSLTKDDLSFIVDSLGSTSAACSCLVITKPLFYDEEFRLFFIPASLVVLYHYIPLRSYT
jgi:hypothetical protein